MAQALAVAGEDAQHSVPDLDPDLVPSPGLVLHCCIYSVSVTRFTMSIQTGKTKCWPELRLRCRSQRAVVGYNSSMGLVLHHYLI